MVYDASFCNVLPKKGVGSVIIGQVFGKCQNVYIVTIQA